MAVRRTFRSEDVNFSKFYIRKYSNLMGNEVCHHHKDPSVNTVQEIIGDGCEKYTKQIACMGRLHKFYTLENVRLVALLG